MYQQYTVEPLLSGLLLSGHLPQPGSSLVPRPSLSLSSAITILEAGKKELVKQEEGLVKLVTWGG